MMMTTGRIVSAFGHDHTLWAVLEVEPLYGSFAEESLVKGEGMCLWCDNVILTQCVRCLSFVSVLESGNCQNKALFSCVKFRSSMNLHPHEISFAPGFLPGLPIHDPSADSAMTRAATVGVLKKRFEKFIRERAPPLVTASTQKTMQTKACSSPLLSSVAELKM